ncbi:MAG: putative metal-binding motif-containing protein, partial [bacterium]|nr:putative metal-binding motif-containing protein [bacterium]
MNPYGSPPDYVGGCGPGSLWATCPPTPFDPSTLDRDGDGFTVADGDCNDADAGIAPGIMEPLCNGVDENCDGVTDGEWETPDAPYTLGDPCTAGVGGCLRDGVFGCEENGITATCLADAGLPVPEMCNGVDDDCDGDTDEEWRDCSPDLPESPCIGNICVVGIGT